MVIEPTEEKSGVTELIQVLNSSAIMFITNQYYRETPNHSRVFISPDILLFYLDTRHRKGRMGVSDETLEELVVV